MKYPLAMRPRPVYVAVALIGLVTVEGIRAVLAPVTVSNRLDTTAALPPPHATLDRVVAGEVSQQDGTTSVVVRINATSDSLSPAQRSALRAMGGHITHALPIIHSVSLRLPRRSLAALSSLPWVEHVSTDTGVRKADEYTVEASGAGAAYNSYGLTGSNITVAVVDSGIAPTDDLKATKGSSTNYRVLATKDYIEDSNNLRDPSGHGTHVAGVIAGDGKLSTGKDYVRTFYGVARKANLVNVRVLDAQGNGDVSNVIAGLQWIIANKSRYGIRIINMSLGHPVAESYTTDPLCQAVEQAWKAGLVVVCSAGNEGRAHGKDSRDAENGGYGTNYGSIRSPGNSPYVITVGAMKPPAFGSVAYSTQTRHSDAIATYSSRGPTSGDLVLKPDLVAPGDRIVSLQAHDAYLYKSFPQNQLPESWYIKGKPASDSSDKYFVLSGSSIAAPVVSAAAALILEKNPNLTPDTVKARLMLTADKWVGVDGKPDPFTYGAGYLNVYTALQSTITTQGWALSPQVSLDPSGALLIGTQASLWPGNTFWGTGVANLQSIWGSAVYANSVVNDQKNLGSVVAWVHGDVILWGGGNVGNTKIATELDLASINGDQ